MLPGDPGKGRSGREEAVNGWERERQAHSTFPPAAVATTVLKVEERE